MTRTIEAPGIQYNEIDRSNYERTQDYSIVGTTALAFGFADKGNDYIAEWINTMQTFEQVYGKPTNEPEQFFYNAAAETLKRGGVFIGAKLPYDNQMKGNFKCVDYKLEPVDVSGLEISSDIMQLSDSFDVNKKIVVVQSEDESICPMSTLDDLLVGKRDILSCNSFRIVDITHQKYAKLVKPNLSAVLTEVTQSNGKSNIVQTNECLGIVPVIITPLNAMYEQGMLQDAQVSNYNAVSAMLFGNAAERYGVPSSSSVCPVSAYCDQISSYFSIPLASSDKNEWSVSRSAASNFQIINYDSEYQIDQQLLAQVMVLVLQAYQDKTNDNNISFRLLEKHIGSLDKTMKDNDGKSLFIDDIINGSSSCIRFFSNANSRMLQESSTAYAIRQKAHSLGFFTYESAKKISSAESVLSSISLMFGKCKNQNELPIDLVVDAGMTNIVQLVDSTKRQQKASCDYAVNFDAESKFRDYNLVLDGKEDAEQWLNAYKLFDSFCKNIRKDCMLLGDAPRALCLQGDAKLVRSTSDGSSVMKSILPKLRFIANKDLNSSYSACYSNWFYQQDSSSGDYFWIPPSIKALGVCIYGDAYFHTWDAPAGMIRGKLNDVVDCAFNPDKDEAGRLYSQGFNYAINYPLDGIVIEGQKTMQLRKTAFDRINVRRLFLSIEKQIRRLGKYFLYQHNTSFQRQRFTDQVRAVLEAAVNGGGISEYAIRCDETNNTPETIDRNELHCKIAVKPIKSIEYIVVDMICTNQSAYVTEEVIK